MQQQPRLVARRRVDFVFVQLDALCPRFKSQTSNRLAISDRTCYTQIFILYACRLHNLCQRRNRPLLLSQYHYPLDIYHHSTSLDPFSVYGQADNVRSQELAFWQATPSNSARC